MAGDRVVFSASRMALATRVGLAVVAFAGGGIYLWFKLTASGGLGRVDPLVDIQTARLLLAIVGCIGVCMVAVLAVPLIIDPRLIFIDDDSIRVRYSVGSRRARWVDFRGATTKTVRNRTFQQLVFNAEDGGNLTVTLPVNGTGINFDDVMAEVQRRLTLRAACGSSRQPVPSSSDRAGVAAARGFGRRAVR